MPARHADSVNNNLLGLGAASYLFGLIARHSRQAQERLFEQKISIERMIGKLQ